MKIIKVNTPTLEVSIEKKSKNLIRISWTDITLKNSATEIMSKKQLTKSSKSI